MGFVSVAAGLICYALSSSFNHLFGNWNLLKVLLYTLFSFIICLMILYANIWQNTRSLRFKAHTAFLVLTITSVYSFFFDKVVNGKPDAYSLISCAAFAIMSMSLSRQTQCGFEVDLLYFFLGCLIMQLMKIKMQLVIVGAGFSYSLIIIRSLISSTNSIAENEYFGVGLHGENSVVIEMDSLLRPSNDIYSRMMQRLTTCTNALQQDSLNIIDRLMDEYSQDRTELHLHGKCDFVMDTLPSGKVHNLHEIVKLMLCAGYVKECSAVYISWRKVLLQKGLLNKIFVLPKAKINTENEHQREEYLDTMFQRWMTASDVATKVLFPIEPKLCDLVFSGFSSVTSHCFIEVCQEATFQLLNFADVIAYGSPSKWCLFKMVDIFEQLNNLIPKFQSLFPDSLVNEAIAVRNRLGVASRELFMKMHNFIFKVPAAKQIVSSYGPRHQMTINVMSYVSSACMKRRTLEQILEEFPKVHNEVEASFFFLKQVEQIMRMLQRKLIVMSENSKDSALRHIFMLNNRSHIEAMNKFSRLETIFGYDWFQNNKAKIQQNLDLYKRCSWDEVMDFLKLDNNDSITEELLKEKIHLFNNRFEAICRVQSAWFIHDSKLKGEIISSVGNILLPAYGIFVGRLQDTLGNEAYNYIKYGMFEIEDRLNLLFLGNTNI